jgi:hypothetical protein
MRRHDKHLVDAKAQYQVKEQVKTETTETEPEKTALPATPDSYGK